MPVLEVVTRIQAPIERVFDLSRSIDMHVASTAQTGERAVAGVTSGLIGPGQEVTWRAKHFGIWQHLSSRITEYDRPIHFRDTLVRGAFKRFDHDHHFSEQGEFTVLRDVFDYVSPFGVFGQIADSLFLERYMRRLLLIRNEMIKQVAETELWRKFLPAG